MVGVSVHVCLNSWASLVYRLSKLSDLFYLHVSAILVILLMCLVLLMVLEFVGMGR